MVAGSFVEAILAVMKVGVRRRGFVRGLRSVLDSRCVLCVNIALLLCLASGIDVSRR
jgi:hypothetical protein